MSYFRRDLIVYGGLASGRSGSAFNPLSLSPHIWLDPSDLSTLFQDSAMTTPVTADGDPVGAILDKSGNGFHATQSTAGLRPTYRTSGGVHWVESLDGDPRRLVVTFSPAVSKPYDFVEGVRFLSGGDNFIHDIDNTNQVYGYLTAGGNMSLGDGGNEFNYSPGVVSADQDVVLTCRLNNASSRGAVDNGSYTTGDDGSQANINTMFIFNRRDGMKADVRFHGHVGFNRLLSDGEIALLRTYLAAKQGRVL